MKIKREVLTGYIYNYNHINMCIWLFIYIWLYIQFLKFYIYGY